MQGKRIIVWILAMLLFVSALVFTWWTTTGLNPNEIVLFRWRVIFPEDRWWAATSPCVVILWVTGFLYREPNVKRAKRSDAVLAGLAASCIMLGGGIPFFFGFTDMGRMGISAAFLGTVLGANVRSYATWEDCRAMATRIGFIEGAYFLLWGAGVLEIVSFGLWFYLLIVLAYAFTRLIGRLTKRDNPLPNP